MGLVIYTLSILYSQYNIRQAALLVVKDGCYNQTYNRFNSSNNLSIPGVYISIFKKETLDLTIQVYGWILSEGDCRAIGSRPYKAFSFVLFLSQNGRTCFWNIIICLCLKKFHNHKIWEKLYNVLVLETL